MGLILLWSFHFFFFFERLNCITLYSPLSYIPKRLTLRSIFLVFLPSWPSNKKDIHKKCILLCVSSGLCNPVFSVVVPYITNVALVRFGSTVLAWYEGKGTLQRTLDLNILHKTIQKKKENNLLVTKYPKECSYLGGREHRNSPCYNRM